MLHDLFAMQISTLQQRARSNRLYFCRSAYIAEPLYSAAVVEQTHSTSQSMTSVNYDVRGSENCASLAAAAANKKSGSRERDPIFTVTFLWLLLFLLFLAFNSPRKLLESFSNESILTSRYQRHMAEAFEIH